MSTNNNNPGIISKYKVTIFLGLATIVLAAGMISLPIDPNLSSSYIVQTKLNQDSFNGTVNTLGVINLRNIRVSLAAQL